MRALIMAVALAALPAIADAQVVFPPPGPGTPVSFVACPERTAGGSWIATDTVSGYTYSLAGVPAPPPNVVIQVTGIVSPEALDVPGWGLAPIRMIVGRQPCQSAGVLQPVPGSFGRGPWFGAVYPAPVSARY